MYAKIDPGQRLQKLGHKTQNFYIILSGSVKVKYKLKKTGKLAQIIESK